jgi:hypothetical protein
MIDSGRINIVIVALILMAAALLFDFTADDSYIVARYAENAIDHGALVFNAGERVNAMTSPLHGLAEALLYLCTGSAILAWKIAAALMLIGGVVAMVSRWRGDHRSIALILTVVALFPPALLWTFGGLETPMLLLLVALFALAAYRDGEPGGKRLIGMAIIAGLAFLARFDSVLFTGPVLVFAAMRNGRARDVTAAIGVGGIIPAAWLIFAWLYFGDILPTSFFVKRPTLRDGRMAESAINILEFLLFTGFLPLYGLGLAAARRSVPTAIRGHLRRTAPLLAGLAAILAYGQLTGMLHMMFSFRMFIPYLPVLAIILCDLHGRLAAGSTPASMRGMTPLLLGVIGLHCVQAMVLHHHSLNGISIVGEYRHLGSASYMEEFIPVLEAGADDIARHWRSLPASRARSPRVSTFAAGALPHHYRDAYIFEPLISYRSNCTTETALSADYIHLLAPTLAAAAVQLPKPMDHYQVISDRTIRFDGALRHFLVLHDPEPAPNPLPGTMHGKCGGK